MSLGLCSFVNVTHSQLYQPVTKSPRRISCNLTSSHIRRGGALLSKISSCWGPVGYGQREDWVPGAVALPGSQELLANVRGEFHLE